MSFNAYGGKITMHKALGKFVAGLAVLVFLALTLATGPARAQDASGPVTILALGDSLTAGYGLDQGDGFVPQLEGWLQEHGRNVTVVNAGVSGDTTAGGRSRLDWSLSDDVDLVLVNLGGNDMLRGLPASETRKNLDAILSNITGRGLPSVLIRVPGSLNFGAGEKAAYDQAFSELATLHHARFVPNFFHALEELGTTEAQRQQAMRDHMQPDGLHPSKSGVGLIVDEIGPVILAALDDLTEQ